MPVHAPSALELRAYTCGRCGGAFQEGASNCPWCEASLVLADRRLAGVCARCSARLDVNARYCPGCGTSVEDQVAQPLAATAGCPRCQARLATRQIGEREIVECSSCGGIWLTSQTFEGLCERAEEAGVWRRNLALAPAPVAPVADAHASYVKCVTCGEFMFRKNMGPGSGLVLDVCKDHGVWFDHEELKRALDYARNGGLDRVREREQRRAEAERERRAASIPSLPGDQRTFAGGAPTQSIEEVVLESIGHLARLLFGSRR